MLGRMGLPDEIGTFRIKLRILCAEVIVNRSAFKDALFHSFALSQFVVPHLHNDAQTLHEEDSAEDGKKQLFMDDDSCNTNDSTDGE